MPAKAKVKKPAAEVWQRLSAPGMARRSIGVPGVSQLVSFTRDGDGWVQIEDAGEPLGREEQTPKGLKFFGTAEIVGRVHGLTVLDETKEVE